MRDWHLLAAEDKDMIEIKDRYTGKVLHVVDADTLQNANLSGANLDGANIVGANLNGASLENTPEVPGLCRAILDQIEKNPASFDMCAWHKSANGDDPDPGCGTTHCMAGWAVHLAGKDGYDMEKKIGPASAGALIFAKSCGSIPNFYSGNNAAIEWLEKHAEPKEADAGGEAQ